MTDASPPKFIRLSSTATYTRATRQEAFAGVKLESTYTRGYSNAAGNKLDMTQRCVAARQEGKRHDMVLEGARAIPLERVEEIRQECDSKFAADTQSKIATQKLATQAAQAASAPLELQSMSDLAQTLGASEKHPIRGQLVKTFFQGGSADGPFPGARSAYGDFMAGAYYEHVRPGEGRMATLGHISKYADAGYKLHNHNMMG